MFVKFCIFLSRLKLVWVPSSLLSIFYTISYNCLHSFGIFVSWTISLLTVLIPHFVCFRFLCLFYVFFCVIYLSSWNSCFFSFLLASVLRDRPLYSFFSPSGHQILWQYICRVTISVLCTKKTPWGIRNRQAPPQQQPLFVYHLWKSSYSNVGCTCSSTQMVLWFLWSKIELCSN